MKVHKLFPLFSIVIIFGGIFSCSENAGEAITSEQPVSYHITDGACGEIIFEESIGTDSLSAVKTIKQRKAENLGHYSFTIKATSLEIEDKNGNVPEEKFFALHVLDGDSLHLHSVSEVITSEGDLFKLSWCPD